MANVLTFSRTTGSSERPAMNHTLASSKFTADQTINVTGNITSIVYKFIFKYTGSSNPSWTGYASIVASDGTIYKGTSLTKTITHDTNVSMSLTIPEANCPPPSVINSNNFKVKLTTTNCGKDPYVLASSKMSIVITYEDKKTQAYVWAGSWTKATPYIWKSTPSTIELPKQAMTSNNSQGCIASSSSNYDNNQQAFRAFNKSISSSDYCWASLNSDTSPWIQITLPQKLYNIELEIHNRHDYNNATGITDAIIYGSNDGGTTLTRIGTISGRSSAFQAKSTETCNNATVGYSTIKLKITGHGGTGAVTVGEIYIRGTDVLESGGWVPVSSYVYNNEWS